MRTLLECTDALCLAAEQQDGDAFDEALRGIVRHGADAPRQEIDAALDRLRPLLAEAPLTLGGAFTKIAANLCMYGSDITVLVPVFVERACGALENAFVFNASWVQLIGDPWPQTAREEAALPDMERFVEVATGRGVPRGKAAEIAAAWAFVGTWVQPVLFLAQFARVRAMLPQRERLTELIRVARSLFEQAHFLHGLLHVLDDAPLIVLHRETGRGFRLRLSGVGDDRQLHTLLAGLLIGPGSLVGLPGRRPAERDIVAASNGAVLDLDEPITGTIILNDVHGQWVWNSVPGEIAAVDGVRVVVIDPPTVVRTWKTARIYPLMVAQIEFDSELPRREAAAWLRRCAPPKRLS